MELLRVEGVSDRKGPDSSFITQRIGQIHGGTQTDTNTLPQRQPHSLTNLTDIQRED